MRILFVTDECFYKSGGGNYTRALIQVFQNIVGKDECIIYFPYKLSETVIYKFDNMIMPMYRKTNYFQKTCNLLCGKPISFSKKSIAYLIEIIREKNIDCVVLGRSTYGGLAKKIKKEYSKILIISFYHDIINEVIRQSIRNKQYFWKNLPRLIACYRNEHISLKYSDVNTVLNEREKVAFVKNYHKEPDAVIPIFVKDCFNNELLQKKDTNICNLLFVGAYFEPNIRGVTWFVQNVMPCLGDDFLLYIVGRDLEKIGQQLECGRNNVKVIGTVDNLDEWYYKADIVVAPIFYGTGMKTKTVEALMYGKVILGTTEAFCGFAQMNDYLCNDAEEFIDKIHRYCDFGEGKRFSEYTRKIYLENYSETVIEKKIAEILQKFDK
jgi:dihydrofolate reductase